MSAITTLTDLSLPVTQRMIDAVTDYMVGRAVSSYDYPARDLVITTQEIADYFDIQENYAEAIHRAIYANPPERLQRVSMSLVWEGVGEYHNTRYE